MMGRGGHLTTVAAALALVGCAVGADYRAPTPAALAVPDRFAATGPAFAAPADEVELSHWWSGLGDPVLDGLIGDALALGPDIAAAGARLRQARGAVRTARAAILPAVTASGSASHTEQIGSGHSIIFPGLGVGGVGGGASQLFSGSTTVYRASADASYEADLFGGVSRSIEAARGDEAAGLENLRDVQRSIVAEVATDYVNARSAQERLAIARTNLRTQDDTVQIVGWRVQAGLVSSLDLAQARAQREQTAATIPQLETSLTQATSAIAILIGRAPGEVQARLADPLPVPAADRMLGADVPLAVLARRPDVRAAERTLAAASARIGVARAQLYPALRLTGSIGGNGQSIGDIGRFSTGALVASLAAPIFDGGAIRGQIEQARGRADEALADYRRAVLTALGDVENAMAAMASTREREVSLTLALDQSRDALLFAQSQYRAGLIDFQRLLDTERALLSSEDGAAAARADRATALVTLYKALGGGWQAAPMPDTAIPKRKATIELPDLASAGPAPADSQDTP